MKAEQLHKSYLVYSQDGQCWIIHTGLDELTPDYLCKVSSTIPDHVIIYGKDKYVNGKAVPKRGK